MHSFRHAFRRDEEAWFLPDDAEWVDAISRTAGAGTGVLIHGEPGAGQVEFAWRVAHRLAARTGLLELACPPDAATSASLAALAADPPPPGRVLLIVDGASFAGPDLEVVARLVIRHRAVVVAAVSDSPAGTDVPLMRHLDLEPVHLRQLTQEAAASFLENGLAGPLSERAAFAVWDSGAGNRSMMRMIVDDWRESGYFVQEDGVWVIRGQVSPAGPRLTRYWQQWLAAQEPAVRGVFEMLSLAGELPLNVVLQLAGSEAVDTVHDLGLLHLRDSTGREASLRGQINAEAISSQVPPGRSNDLLNRVTDYVDGIGLHRPPGLVAWRLHCGLPVLPARFLEGAEHVLMSSAPAEALELLKRVPPDFAPARVQAVRIGALLASGQFVDLWTLAGNLRLGSAGAGGSGSPGETLPAPGGTAGADAREEVPAADLIAASWRGDFRPILEAAESPPLLPEDLTWLWQQITDEALVITGSVQEGLHRDRELLHLLEQSDRAPFLVQRGRLGLFDMESLAGEWAHAAATLAGGWNAETGAPGRGRTGTLYNAIAHVLLADFETSADMLRRELPQLRALGRHDLLPLAHSIHAVSLSRIGHRAEALAALAAVELPRATPGGAWRLAWAATYFSAQAMGCLGLTQMAVARLVECAERDRQWGNHSQELLTLSAAVQWGHEPSLVRLEEVAGLADGRFAEACTWVARGLRTGDPAELEYGALLSRTLGQHFFADYAQQRLEALNGPCPKAVEEAVRERAEGPRETAAPSQGLHVLTPRQRDIAYHVMSGKSNSDIARNIGVSVRTVESHLYQTYAKLNVSNRAELRGALADWYPAS